MKDALFDFHVTMARIALEAEWRAFQRCIMRVLLKYPRLDMWQASHLVTYKAFKREMKKGKR